MTDKIRTETKMLEGQLLQRWYSISSATDTKHNTTDTKHNNWRKARNR